MIFLILILFPLSLLSFEGFNLPEGKWWKNEELIRQLNLSLEQQKQLEKIFFTHLERAIDLRAVVEKEELKLRELLDEEEISEKRVLEQVDKLLEARKALERQRAELFLKVRLILTPEQWKNLKGKYQDKIRRMKEERRRMHKPQREPVPSEPLP